MNGAAFGTNNALAQPSPKSARNMHSARPADATSDPTSTIGAKDEHTEHDLVQQLRLELAQQRAMRADATPRPKFPSFQRSF